jgi:hypothetical protein
MVKIVSAPFNQSTPSLSVEALVAIRAQATRPASCRNSPETTKCFGRTGNLELFDVFFVNIIIKAQ